MNPHPIRLTVTDDLRRSRLTVFFRLLLALPHFVWLYLWNVLATIALLLNWLVTLVMGRPFDPFHRFLSAYLRYQTHLYAFVTLAANPFPGFTGRLGSYPVDVELPAAGRQSRWKTLLRLLLAFPALLVGGTLGYAAGVGALCAWFAALVTGRMPNGIRDLLTYYLRYSAQVNGYVYLITDRYPYAGPTEPGAATAAATEPLLAG
jgi:hypothetical protein